MVDTPLRAKLADVFRAPEFRALWLAEVLSICGDQFARVALSVMVFDATSSAALTSLTYALTYAPSLAGGILLARFADRWPRREVMVVVDLLRAGPILLAAVPALPFWILCLLVGSVSFLNPVFKAAQLALLPDLLPGEGYPKAMAVRQVTVQVGQLAGFAGGGVLTAAITPRTALTVDAATFVVSALLLRVGLRFRPGAVSESGHGVRHSRLRWLSATGRRVRLLMLLCWLMAAITVYEALAAPYAAALGAGPSTVGLLLVSDPLGAVVGVWVFTRWVPTRLRERLVGPLAVLAAAPLVLCLAHPGLIWTILLFVCSGALGTVVVMQATTSLTLAVPNANRARVLGVSNTGLTAASGLSPLAAGLFADRVGAVEAVGWFGVAGVLIAIPLVVMWRRAESTAPIGG